MQQSSQAFLSFIHSKMPELGFAKTLVSWYRKQDRKLPWRERFAATRDPYAVWVSEIMLQQTTIQAVIPAYLRFFQLFPDVYALARGTEDEVRLACRGLGYYRRFRFLHQAAQDLTAQHPQSMTWPQNFKGWRELAGVGDYTAAAVSSIAFNFPKGVVDGNVERVLCRIFDLRVVPDGSWKKTFQLVVDQLIDPESSGDFNQALMELGQTVCTKQNPDCPACPVVKICKSQKAESQHLAPKAKKPIAYEDVSIHMWILEKDGHVGLVQRSDKARFLKGSLGFPSAIETKSGQLEWECEGSWKTCKKQLGPFRHSITKHRIAGYVHLETKARDLDRWQHQQGLMWVPLPELEGRLVSNLDRKALKLYERSKPRPQALDMH